jgi:hypothetical protein
MSTPPDTPAPPVPARQRIKRISVSGYRAFPPYKPKSLEIDLGDTGKNLLLYGEVDPERETGGTGWLVMDRTGKVNTWDGV